MRYGLWDMGYEIGDIRYGIWVMGYEIWDMGYEIWVMGYESHSYTPILLYSYTSFKL
jgi:hypothetical protein